MQETNTGKESCKMKKRGIKKSTFEELTETEIKEKDMILFDKSDKPFLTLYLFIFIFGIIITIISV